MVMGTHLLLLGFKQGGPSPLLSQPLSLATTFVILISCGAKIPGARGAQYGGTQPTNKRPAATAASRIGDYQGWSKRAPPNCVCLQARSILPRRVCHRHTTLLRLTVVV